MPSATLSPAGTTDRKSTRLNSSHLGISYAGFCFKKKRSRRRRWLHCVRRPRGPSRPGGLVAGGRARRCGVIELYHPAHVYLSIFFFFFFHGGGAPTHLPFLPSPLSSD